MRIWFMAVSLLGEASAVGRLLEQPEGITFKNKRFMTYPMLQPEDLHPVLTETSQLAELFAARGKRLFLVGGAVRDLVLGRDLESVDLDFTTDALPDEIKQIVETTTSNLWTQGEKFGTIGCVIGGRGCEITTHRKEAYDHDSRKPTVEFGKDITEDLARRDFTINSIAIELPEGTLVDPFEGISAVNERVLATPLSAEESFSDDPLRMLRAARFVAQFNLTPTEEVVAAMSEMGDRLEIVSVERITDELEKTLLLEDPMGAFGLLVSTGLSSCIFGEGFAGRAVGKRLGQLSPSLELRLAGLFMESEGSNTGEAREKLRFPKSVSRKATSIGDLAESWLRILSESESESESEAANLVVALRRWKVSAGASSELSRAARELAAVVAGERGLSSQHAGLEKLYLENDVENLKMPVSGNEIMEHLQLPPGPLVGEAIAHLNDILIQKGQITKSEALEQVVAWWADRHI